MYVFVFLCMISLVQSVMGLSYVSADNSEHTTWYSAKDENSTVLLNVYEVNIAPQIFLIYEPSQKVKSIPLFTSKIPNILIDSSPRTRDSQINLHSYPQEGLNIPNHVISPDGVTMINTITATPPRVTSVNANCSSIVDGGSILVTVNGTSDLPITYGWYTFISPTKASTSSYPRISYNSTTHEWSGQIIETISPYAQSGVYAFTNIGMRNSIDEMSVPWNVRVNITVNNSMATTPPRVTSVNANCSSIVDGGSILVTVNGTSDLPITYGWYTFISPTKASTSSYPRIFYNSTTHEWSGQIIETISPYAQSGVYAFTNIGMRNSIDEMSVPWNVRVNITVNNPGITSSFTANVTSGAIPLAVQFTDTSTGIPTSWNWSFGDGILSTTQNPVHTYTVAGNYSVALNVTNIDGSNSTTRLNYIHVSPSIPAIFLPENATVFRNVSVSIPINMANLKEAGGFAVNLAYNPSVIRLNSVTANKSAVGSALITNITPGIARIVMTNTDGITIGESIPVLSLAVTGISADMTVTSLAATNASWSDLQFIAHPINVQNGSIRIGVRGDFYGDGIVDIGDVTRTAYMVVGRAPALIPEADFNNNQIVDIGDAGKIAYYFVGKVQELSEPLSPPLPDDWSINIQVASNGEAINPQIITTLLGGNGISVIPLIEVQITRSDGSVETVSMHQPLFVGKTVSIAIASTGTNRVEVWVTTPVEDRIKIFDEYVPFRDYS